MPPGRLTVVTSEYHSWPAIVDLKYLSTRVLYGFVPYKLRGAPNAIGNCTSLTLSVNLPITLLALQSANASGLVTSLYL